MAQWKWIKKYTVMQKKVYTEQRIIIFTDEVVDDNNDDHDDTMQCVRVMYANKISKAKWAQKKIFYFFSFTVQFV